MTKVVVLTMCGVGGCPRIAITGKGGFFRDDYKGKVKMGTKLIKKMSIL